VRRSSGIAERLGAEVTILKKELDEIKAVHSKRKERATGKCFILKGKAVISMEELVKELEKAEKRTNVRKKNKKHRKKKRTLNSDGGTTESEISERGSPRDSPASVHPEILDCTEVAW
jgi:hypothetical protein